MLNVVTVIIHNVNIHMLKHILVVKTSLKINVHVSEYLLVTLRTMTRCCPGGPGMGALDWVTPPRAFRSTSGANWLPYVTYKISQSIGP